MYFKKVFRTTLLFTTGAAFLALINLSLQAQPARTNPPGAAAPGATSNQPAPAARAESGGDFTLMMTGREYEPLPADDSMVDVKNVNFNVRSSPDGTGEILDVVFDIENLAGEPTELYAFVMAFHETNTVDKTFRRLIPYPTWRRLDVDKDNHVVLDMSVSPEPIDPEEIWSQEDPDWNRHQKNLKKMRNSPAERRYIPEIYPPYWKYLNFMFLNPKRGKRFMLAGQNGPVKGATVDTNFPQELDENGRIKFIETHTYTIEPLRRRTIFRSHHYQKFSPGRKEYNMATIVLFDAKRADRYFEQMRPLVREIKTVQQKRLEADRQVYEAEKSEDKQALRKALAEKSKVTQMEADLRRKRDKILNDNYHLFFSKTYKVKYKRH